ncbi:MAG: ABC transporter permease [Treponema sp.]|jgi:simple sugar transport system permease protein|nr:ABC transporter permease [Treponema sp.]
MEMIIIDGLSFAMPLFIMAVGGIFCERSGIIMLALEGLQGFGAFIGALAVILLKPVLGEASPFMIYFAMAAAMFGGMTYSLLHAALCVRFKAGQTISGVVVNILSVALTTFFTSVINKALTGDATNRFQIGVSMRFTVPGISKIPVIGNFFKNMYPFEVVILILAAFAWYLFYRTRFGLRLRACGDNPHSLDTAGGDVGATQVKAIMITGAFSGFAGMCFAYSIMANFSPTIYIGYGYLAIAAMIFGNWEILSTFAVCLFFGLARSGGYQLCLILGMSSNFSDLFLVLPYVLTLLSLVFFSKHNHPPRAIGEIFDKGKR